MVEGNKDVKFGDEKIRVWCNFFNENLWIKNNFLCVGNKKFKS